MKHLLLDNPAPLFFGVFLLSVLVLRLFPRLSSRFLLRLCSVAGAVSLLAYLMIALLNINRVGMVWHDEANILSIAGAYANGQQMYHAVASADFYSLFYGPSTFLVYAPFLAKASHPLLPIRLAMAAVNILNAVLVFALLRIWASRAVALALLPVAVAIMLAYMEQILGSRGDTWLLLCVLIATLSAFGRPKFGWLAASIVSGVFAGLAVDFKITVAVVVAILIAVFYRRFGMRAAVVFAAIAVATTLSVFALPHISLHNYVAWLIISSHQRLLKSTALSNLLASLFLLGPLVLVMLFGLRHRKPNAASPLILALVGIAFLVFVVTGSKDGAGGWHLWPVMPFALAAAAMIVASRLDDPDAGQDGNKTASAVASIAIAATCVALVYASRDFRAVRPPGDGEWRQKESDAQGALDQIVVAYGAGHNLVMGSGENVTDYRTDLRYELPLARQLYFFDENEVVEGIKAHFPMPQAVTERVLGCGSVWVIPHGEAPFSSVRTGVLPVTTTPYIFPDEIRLHFGDQHVVVRRGPVYDLWQCPSDASNDASH